ncbi:MAG: hypothetical protein KDA61_20735 [Planctomycetales bacterium]|nr:hypothetical protein [Planctomycetales bacterium]
MWQKSAENRRRLEASDRQTLRDLQLSKLNDLIKTVVPTNRLYADKLARCKLPLQSLDELSTLPFTTKEELTASGSTPANLTWPLDRYVRFHQTSGTRGRPLPVYDTAEDWQWWTDSWQFVLDAAQITDRDRALLAFSIGPFIGFWSARDALSARGTMVIPGAG